MRACTIPCLVALFALISPRLALFLLWIFSDVLSRAFNSWLLGSYAGGRLARR